MLYDEEYKNIYNIDISKTVIDNMSNKYIDKKQMKWQTMDVLDLKFSDNEFDAIIDKSTLDAILCTNQSFSNVLVMLKEI